MWGERRVDSADCLDGSIKEYHMQAGTTAVLFLVAAPGDLYTTVCGDGGLLLVGGDGHTLTPPGEIVVPGLATVEQVAALY